MIYWAASLGIGFSLWALANVLRLMEAISPDPSCECFDRAEIERWTR